MNIKERIDNANIELAAIEKEVSEHLFPSEVKILTEARTILYRLYKQASKWRD